MQVPIEEAGERLEELVDLANAGQEIFLTRDGEPVVRLRALQPNSPGVPLGAALS
jgi:antitoxin (DNA-binding transcriptional repressor) of toxin-antitoxin stability system